MGTKAPWPGDKARQAVLVVEDEPLQRMMAMDLVQEAGFEAVSATNANQAIAILERRTDITIVFTDVDLPGGLDGMKLAAMIRDRWPPIQFIVTSGQIDLMTEQLPPNSKFFNKPYHYERIMEALHRLAG